MQVLKQGLVWRIGTGETTDPSNDPWIPRDGMLRPIVCLADYGPTRVAGCIDAATATWKEEKLRQLPMDVEAIMQTSLSNGSQEDFWAWLND
jgi:hypothetical protein